MIRFPDFFWINCMELKICHYNNIIIINIFNLNQKMNTKYQIYTNKQN